MIIKDFFDYLYEKNYCKRKHIVFDFTFKEWREFYSKDNKDKKNKGE